LKDEITVITREIIEKSGKCAKVPFNTRPPSTTSAFLKFDRVKGLKLSTARLDDVGHVGLKIPDVPTIFQGFPT